MLTVILFTGPLARFTSAQGELLLQHSGLYDATGNRMELAAWPMTVLFGIVAALSFFTLFSYKNRMRQIRLCIFLIFLCAGMTGMMFYYTWFVGNTFEAEHPIYLWRFGLPPVCMITLYLAFRRIRRDELLVKAYDRIR